MYFATASRNVLVTSERHLQAFAKIFSLHNPYCWHFHSHVLVWIIGAQKASRKRLLFAVHTCLPFFRPPFKHGLCLGSCIDLGTSNVTRWGICVLQNSNILTKCRASYFVLEVGGKSNLFFVTYGISRVVPASVIPKNFINLGMFLHLCWI